MFAVGHLALGHLCGYAASKKLKTDINIPLLLILAIIPDIDIIIPQLHHRGPTHSIIAATILFIPLFIIYKKKAIPYYAALAQHSLIGDFITGGKIQLLWPLNSQYYGSAIGITNPINMTAEWILFSISIFMILRTDQINIILHPHHSNLLLAIPVFTVLLPTLLSFPLKVPLILIPPHLAYTALFSTSIIIDILKPTPEASIPHSQRQ